MVLRLRQHNIGYTADGAERPKTWGGSSQKLGRIDPGRIDSGADRL